MIKIFFSEPIRSNSTIGISFFIWPLFFYRKKIFKKKMCGKVKKKIYNLMVEGLQNITRHQAQYKDHSHERNGLFVLQKKGNGYFITTGNLINSSEIESLKTKLEKVNLLNKEELKEHFKNQLVMGEISNKGGAGLGLLDMARKSGNKLAFDFVQIDKNYSYFYFRLEVNSESEIELPIADFSLNYVSLIHKFVNNKDIAVIYNDIFDQDVQRNLLSYLEKRLKDTIFSKPLVVETVSQTIKTVVEQGDTADDLPNSKPAIFFINKEGNDYLVNCGSYIHNSKINILKNRFWELNQNTAIQLSDYFATAQVRN
ncbi:MAG: DUF6272 family protein, partial [Bacteroidota bacterium]